MSSSEAHDRSAPTSRDRPTEREVVGPAAPPTVNDSLGGPAPPVPRTLEDSNLVPVLPSSLDPTEVLQVPIGGVLLEKFAIRREIGRGGLAVVYLAEQIPFAREVALKVSLNRGTEGRTMASLAHPNIVAVHDEDVEKASNRRLLCMELVRGASLDKILHHLRHQATTWTGTDLLSAVQATSTVDGALVIEALAHRQRLEVSTHTEAACSLICQLADALAHAHNHDVVHRDIKPGNVIVDHYGRVKLADFNISLDPERLAGVRGEIFGGTLDYMAPEHIDAFNPNANAAYEAVDDRSDIYAVGLLFYELLTGDLPFATARSHATTPDTLDQLAGERRNLDPETIRRHISDEGLASVIIRCLDPDPGKRFHSAEELQRAVRDCIERERLRKVLPPLGRVASFLERHPLLGLALLAFLPHLIGSVVNIGYNMLRIVSGLPESQQILFGRLVISYNVIVYPLCLYLMLRVARPWVRLVLDRKHHRPIEPERFREVRKQSLFWPRWAVILAALGWFPGTLFFPLGLHLLGGGVAPIVFARFAMSFTLSALIALTYSLLGVRFIVLRILYPDLLMQTSGLTELTRRELPPTAGHGVTLLAGLIPLTAAVLTILLGPMAFTSDNFSDGQDHGSLHTPFQFLLTALIILGMLGFFIAVNVQAYLDRTLLALRGQTDRS
jgi:serine/threonine protein kinase